MKRYWKNFVLFCVVLALLLTACSTGGRQRITPDELDPALNQEIDPDKEILIYARTSPISGSSNLFFDRQAVDKFNRTHDDVQILVKDYYGSAEERGQNYERLLSEMAAGQVPDIIDLSGFSYRQMVQKGYLEDLWPYIENDPDLGRDGVLEAPLKAAEVDGGLYAAFGSVTIDTLVGTASQVGDRTSWTFQELQDAFAAMPEGATIFEFNTSREEVASHLMLLSMEDYVDWETGTCSFDSPGFRSMLEFIGQFPTSKEVDEETAAFADLQALLTEAEERSMKGLQMLDIRATVTLRWLPTRNAEHGGQCAFVGYPVEDGSVGSAFEFAGSCLAMSSACGNKEAAWEFLRMAYLNPRDDGTDDNYAIPVRKSLYDKQKDRLMTEKQEIFPFVFAMRESVTVPPLTEEEVRRFEDFFNSIDKIDITWNRTLIKLVLETCGPYFSGDKSLDETVALVQNRVGLYISEQK